MGNAAKSAVCLAALFLLPTTFLNFTGTLNAYAAAPVHDCDRLAANPVDPDGVFKGPKLPELDYTKVIPVCETAIKAHPDEPRFNYQLGRALIRGKKFEQGRNSLLNAAAAGYRQAMLNIGLLYLQAQGVETITVRPLSGFGKLQSLDTLGQ